MYSRPLREWQITSSLRLSFFLLACSVLSSLYDEDEFNIKIAMTVTAFASFLFDSWHALNDFKIIDPPNKRFNEVKEYVNQRNMSLSKRNTFSKRLSDAEVNIINHPSIGLFFDMISQDISEDPVITNTGELVDAVSAISLIEYKKPFPAWSKEKTRDFIFVPVLRELLDLLVKNEEIKQNIVINDSEVITIKNEFIDALEGSNKLDDETIENYIISRGRRSLMPMGIIILGFALNLHYHYFSNVNCLLFTTIISMVSVALGDYSNLSIIKKGEGLDRNIHVKVTEELEREVQVRRNKIPEKGTWQKRLDQIDINVSSHPAFRFFYNPDTRQIAKDPVVTSTGEIVDSDIGIKLMKLPNTNVRKIIPVPVLHKLIETLVDEEERKASAASEARLNM